MWKTNENEKKSSRLAQCLLNIRTIWIKVSRVCGILKIEYQIESFLKKNILSTILLNLILLSQVLKL